MKILEKYTSFSIFKFHPHHPHHIVLFILIFFLQFPSYAVEVALGPRVGSAGVSMECYTGLFSNLNARVAFNLFPLQIKGSKSEFDYDIHCNFKSCSLLFDWMLTRADLRISSGLFVNYNNYDFTINPTRDYQVGAIRYESSEIGHMEGKVDFNRFAPYAGFGWGNPLKQNRKLTFVVDIGFFYQNSPQVDFSASGLIAPSADQEGQIAQDLEAWRIYGILSIGLMYKL